MRHASTALTGLCVLALAACATGEAPPDRAARGTAARPPVVIRPLFAADHMAAASSIDLFAMRSAELAATRAAAPAHRAFAATMMAEHQGTSAQLSFAGRRLNLLPSATLLPAHQAMLDELAASGDFDAIYHRQQIAVHQAAVKLHGDFAARGESATLRPVAANAARVVRRHLDLMRRM